MRCNLTQMHIVQLGNESSAMNTIEVRCTFVKQNVGIQRGTTYEPDARWPCEEAGWLLMDILRRSCIEGQGEVRIEKVCKMDWQCQILSERQILDGFALGEDKGRPIYFRKD